MKKILVTTFSLILFLISGCSGKNGEKNGETINNLSDSLELNEAALGDSLMIIEGDTIKGAKNNSEPKASVNPNRYIIIDKPNCKLYVVNGTDTIFKGPICAGRNRGNKQAKDDRRTPEGTFKISHIHDATDWLYHTDDGRWVKNVYGPWFLRLDAGGWHGIGIHGTNAPAQIGQRRSKGCIRMKNEDIRKVHDLAFVGMEVRILPDVGKWDPSPGQTSSKKSTPAAEEENTVNKDDQQPEVEPTSPEAPEIVPVAEPQNKEPESKPEPAEPATPTPTRTDPAA